MKQIIKYLDEHLSEAVDSLPKINKRIVKSALIYQHLMHKHGIESKYIEEIIKMHPSIGLLGPGNGCLTRVLEFCMSWSNLFCRHACLHDAYGRFFQDYGKDVGYLYAVKKSVLPILRTIPLLGHISGLYLCSLYDF